MPTSFNLDGVFNAGVPLPVTSASVAATVLNQGASNYTIAGNTADLAVGSFSQLAVDILVNAASGATPSLAFFIERKGADGSYYTMAAPTALTAAGQVNLSIGAGLTTAVAFGSIVRVRWTITGTTPSFNFSISVIGK